MTKQKQLTEYQKAQAALIAREAINIISVHYVSKAQFFGVGITIIFCLAGFLFVRPDLQKILRGEKLYEIKTSTSINNWNIA